MHRITAPATIASVIFTGLTGCLDIDYGDADSRRRRGTLRGVRSAGALAAGDTRCRDTRCRDTRCKGHSIDAMSLSGFTSDDIACLSLAGTELTGLFEDGTEAEAADMVGVEFDVVLSSGDEGTLTLTSFAVDTSINTMFEAANQSNSDVFLYTATIGPPGRSGALQRLRRKRPGLLPRGFVGRKRRLARRRHHVHVHDRRRVQVHPRLGLQAVERNVFERHPVFGPGHARLSQLMPARRHGRLLRRRHAAYAKWHVDRHDRYG